VRIPKAGVVGDTPLQDSGIRESRLLIANNKPNTEMLFNPASNTRIVESNRLMAT
jgi:hypothetical protein